MFFFILPVGVDFRARRYPIVTFTLMGICVLVYLVTLLFRLATGPDASPWVHDNLWLIPAQPHWWTWISSLFVHSGFFHLAGNMVYLFLFGACVEDLIGRARFTVFYLLCGLAASLAHITFSPANFASIPLGGASGAISGCIGGFLLLLARTRIEFKWVFVFMFRIWSGEFFVPAWVVISFWFLDALWSAIQTALSNSAGGGVAFAAHVGGTLAGVALMALERTRLKLHPETDDSPDEPEPAVHAPVTRPAKSTRKRVVPPVSIAAESPSIYLHSDGIQTGPYTPSQVNEMFAAGTLPSDASYWENGMDEWRSVGELRPPGTSA